MLGVESMTYKVRIIACNDYTELQLLISRWLESESPEHIEHAILVADGAEYCYTAMFLFRW